jgi:TonB family protein
MKVAIIASALSAASWASLAVGQNVDGWQFEALNGSCSIGLPAGSDGTVLKLSRSPGNDFATLSITGPGAERFSRRALTEVVLHLDPGGDVTAKADISPGFLSPTILSIRSEARDFPARVLAARAVRVRQGKQVKFELDLPDASAAIAQMRECERVGLQAAGIDAAHWQSLRAGPVPVGDLVNLVKVKDYPKEAVRAGASGLVMVRLTVAASGRPERCDYVVRSGHDSLDRVTCKIFLERARFRPAVGPDGKAVAAPFVTKISWRTG